MALTPRKPVHQLTTRQRIMGRAIDLPAHVRPENEAQEDLAGDAVLSLMDAPPLREQVPAERSLNQTLIKYAKGLDAYKNARGSCAGNLPASLMAGGLLFNRLQADETINEAMQQQADLDEKQNEANAAEAAANALEQQPELTPEQQQQLQQMREQAQQAQTEASQMAQQLQDRVEQLIGNPTNQAAITRAMREAADTGKETAKVMAGWGIGSGTPARIDAQQAMNYLQRMNSEKLKKIALAAGRFRGIASDARSQRVVRGSHPTGVIRTQDPLQIFPTYLARISPLAPDAIRKLALAEFAEGGLPGTDRKSNANDSGDFVGATDVSGSMQYGMREVLAKGVMLGLAQAKKAEHRKYKLFSFSSDPNNIVSVDYQQGWPEHLDWAEKTIAGGTDFDLALTMTMRYIEEIGAKKTDVVFGSDGDGMVSEAKAAEWRAFSQRTGARLIYVPVANSRCVGVTELADMIFPVADLLAEGAADELTRKLAQAIR
jgi:uncharacterized protein with von Willebrand factor type A (vWA) domain